MLKKAACIAIAAAMLAGMACAPIKASAAKTNTAENGFLPEQSGSDSESVLRGDINHDGTLTSSDALTILCASVGLIRLEREYEADIDGDGEVTSADALEVLRASVYLNDLIPRESDPLTPQGSDSGEIRYKAGDTVTVSVQFGNITEGSVGAFNYNVYYDPEYLEPVTDERGRIQIEDLMVEDYSSPYLACNDSYPGSVYLAMSAVEGIDNDTSGAPADLVKINFKVLKDASELGIEGKCASLSTVIISNHNYNAKDIIGPDIVSEDLYTNLAVPEYTYEPEPVSEPEPAHSEPAVYDPPEYTYEGYTYKYVNNYSVGEIKIIRYTGDASEITIPSEINGSTVTYIDDNAFSDCTSIKSITIPDSVTNISLSAFSGCTSLTSITAGMGIAGNYGHSYRTSVRSIHYGNVFAVCDNLKTVILPEKLTAIADDTFMDCKSLTEISIPEAVTHIGTSAFEGCTNLTKVTISKWVVHIGADAFSGCPNLKIYGSEGSYAQIYAKTYNIPFVALDDPQTPAPSSKDQKPILEPTPEPTPEPAPEPAPEPTPEPAPDQTSDSTPKPSAPAFYGDMDGDGTITSGDALNILRASVQLNDLTPEQFKLADIDNDGTLTSSDALSVLRASVGLGGGSIVGKQA